jgi:hypothetical protein
MCCEAVTANGLLLLLPHLSCNILPWQPAQLQLAAAALRQFLALVVSLHRVEAANTSIIVTRLVQLPVL